MLIDGGNAGVPFTTFYPAVMLASLLLGWRWGALVTVGCAGVANNLLMNEPLRFYASGREALLVTLFFLSCAMLVATAELARRMVRQLERAKEREQFLNRELMHRVKNMLTTVGAMATMTARHSAPEDFQKTFAGRMQAMQRATDLLGTGSLEMSDLNAVLDKALAPFRAGSNFVVEGPPCELPRVACVPLSLALHELCTNALKYGALSVPEGRVDLHWTVGEGADDQMLMVWREMGGPPVQPPTTTGLGTQLLRRQRELGEVDLDYDPAGLRCTIAMPGVRAL